MSSLACLAEGAPLRPTDKHAEREPARRIIGLFAGIGGLERGFATSGFKPALLCENAEPALAVLRARFPDVPEMSEDITTLSRLPAAEVVAGGFPCTDLSPAGAAAGISGAQSGLVTHVFRLLQSASEVRWLLLENVPFMLQLGRGAAIRFLVESLEAMGFRWAYRVIDTRAFGIPQRRRRVFLLASRDEDPAPVLLGTDAEPNPPPDIWRFGGFYWTEGNRGLGWAREGIPPLKGSSGVGIPSAPAIWDRSSGRFLTPSIRVAERLQGFPPGWTAPARTVGGRWKLVGNAVSVPVARWIASRLSPPAEDFDLEPTFGRMREGDRWPLAATGHSGSRCSVDVGDWPVRYKQRPLHSFLRDQDAPLSLKAAEGFLRRALASRLRFEEGFLEDLEEYVSQTREAHGTAAHAVRGRRRRLAPPGAVSPAPPR